MMADEKTAVFVADEEGKPKQIATFSNPDDAAFFARQRLTRFGTLNYVGSAKDKDAIKAAVTPPEAARPINNAMEAKVSQMRANAIQEQADEAIREAVSDSAEDAVAEVKEAAEAAAEAQAEAAEEEDASEADDSEMTESPLDESTTTAETEADK